MISHIYHLTSYIVSPDLPDTKVGIIKTTSNSTKEEIMTEIRKIWDVAFREHLLEILPTLDLDTILLSFEDATKCSTDGGNIFYTDNPLYSHLYKTYLACCYYHITGILVPNSSLVIYNANTLMVTLDMDFKFLNQFIN